MAANKITITMSESRPLTIDPETWPLIADVRRHSEVASVRWISVREHRDGRRIVYGAHSPGPRRRITRGAHSTVASFGGLAAGYLIEPTAELRDVDGGALVRTPDDTATIHAIRRVAGVVGDATLGSRCIAHLPALELA